MKNTFFAAGRMSVLGHAILLLALASPAALISQETLTNADVVKMVQAHLSTNVIVGQIENNPGHYALTTNSLIQLKQAGVPDKVIAAMEAKGGTSSEPTRSGGEKQRSPTAARGTPERNPYAWEVKNFRDRMTDERRMEAYLTERPNPGSSEELETKATCDKKAMLWTIAYYSGTAAARSFYVNHPSATVIHVYPANLLGALMAMADGKGPQFPWVDMQVRVDQGAAADVHSSVEYSNVATAVFRDPKVPSPAQAGFQWSVDDVIKAQRVLVALPKEDGSQIYLEVHPQVFSFQKFAGECGFHVQETPKVIAGELADGDLGRPLTADEFAKGLPDLLSETAESRGDSPQLYDKEAPYLGEIVKRCASYSGALRSSPLEDLGKAFADCNRKEPIDISRELGSRHGPEGTADVFLSLSWTRDPEYFNNFGPIVALGIGNLTTPLVPEVDIQPTADPNGPQLWKPATHTNSDSKALQITGYQAGPTWIAAGGSVRIGANLFDTGAPPNSAVRVEVLRAPDVDSKPGDWETVTTKTVDLKNGTGGLDLYDQARTPGRFWYGMRVTDAGNQQVREPAPLLVRVASVDQIDSAPASSPFPGGTDIVLGAAASGAGGELEKAEETASKWLKVIRVSPTAAGVAQITAPGKGMHDYNVFHIDADDFISSGGQMQIDIEVDASSQTDALVDLFPQVAQIPARGWPEGVLRRLSVPRGTSAQLIYQFQQGQEFQLGLEGSQSSPKGATGTVRFRVSVR